MRMSLRVQASGASVQVQPVPLIAVAVKPAGRVSVTVTKVAAGLADEPILATEMV